MENNEKIKGLWINLLKNPKNAEKKNFTILLPPPNITGSLHIGHFLNWSLQDLLMRHAYAKGLNPNWIVGLDHAGISMQFVVERELDKIGINRHMLSFEEFYEKTLEWKEKSEAMITAQAMEFGFLFDWSKRRFTMDQDYKNEVLDAFIALYNDGLITKRQRATNFDVVFETALSDLEIVEKLEKKNMYIIRYDQADGNDHILIGTSRPETIFADVAIAVHPQDERWKHLHGKSFKIPIINRKIPLILDETIEIEKGTGALKVTPAQDMKDYEIGQRHGLPSISIIGKNGRLFDVPEKYSGKTTAEAREIIEAELRENGHLIEIQETEGLVYYGEKSQKPIETIITMQWFLDVSNMAKIALENSSKIEFIPENIKETFAYWMNNIKPWCISRQILWGHRLPIFYAENGQVICAKSMEEAQKIATKNGLENAKLTQETDVLDTWFSSALWPISTQKNGSEDLFAPTDILITGKDILFFWVARMVMFSLYFKGQIPFHKVYFNGIVRDADRQKMSKTRGNVLDPMDLEAEYGKDSLRFAMIRKASFGKDIAIQTKDLEDGRAFGTKIKNATKFIRDFMSKNYNPNPEMDNWMQKQIEIFAAKMDEATEKCAFHEVCSNLYDLFWNNFCAWYIEGLKKYPSPRAKEFLIAILKISHPIIPWISEECFQDLQEKPFEMALLDQPNLPKLPKISTAKFEQIIDITTILRKLKAISEIKDFYVENSDAELIATLTKLPLNKDNNFAIKFGGENLAICYIKEEVAKQAKEQIQKEFSQVQKNLEFNKNRLNSAKNVPYEILEDWQDQLQKLSYDSKILEEWLINLS